MQDCRSGFSLLELAMVLVISGLMMSVVIKALPLQGSDSGGVASGSGASGGSSGQYGCTRERIAGAREAIENFARVNKRLPMPAARNIGVEDANYGREAIAASIVQAGGVSFGALPFQALGLPTTIAGDCWGNKFSYAVTTALTTSATSGGFMDDTVKGNITLKSTLANTNSTIIAYAIIGHGEDALGAVKLNHTAGNGWCAGAALKHLNCAANDAVLADGIFNNGAGAGANYFDDMVMAAGKPLITVAPTVFKTYCWGDNSWGQQANGTYDLASPQLTPRLIPLPGGVTSYSSVSVGPWDACAIGNNGVGYCWGPNWEGIHGNGTSTESWAPSAVTFPAGVTSWKALRIGGSISCGIGNTDWVYCWGSGLYGDTGQWGYGTWPAGVGNNSSAGSLTPVAVTSPGGGVTSFSQIAVGISAACAIANDNKVYCWGANERGSIGNSTSTGVGSAPALRPTLVTMPAGVTSFSKIVSGQDYFCALSNTNRAYCWGQNYFGQVGDGSGGGAYSGVWDEYVNRPSLMQLPVSSATSVVDISASRWGACITGNDYKRYCTGDNFMGQIGDGNMWVNVAIKVPTAHARGDTIVAMDDGGVGAFRSTYYIDNLNQLWTGGLNQYGEMGNGTTNGTNPNATFYKVPYPPGITKWNRVMGGGEAVCAQGS